MSKHIKLMGVALFGLCVACMRAPVPMWIMPTAMPVERVIENLEAAAEEHPDDQEVFINLGRAYTYRFQFSASELQVFPRKNGYTIPDSYNEHPASDRKLSVDEKVACVEKGIGAFQRAIEISPLEPLPYLGMANLLREGAEYARVVSLLPTPAYGRDIPQMTREDHFDRIMSSEIDRLESDLEWFTPRLSVSVDQMWVVMGPEREQVDALLDAVKAADKERRGILLKYQQGYWEHQASEYYIKAFALSFPVDSFRGEQPMRGIQTTIAWEAGTEYLKQVRKLGVIEADQPRIKLVETGIKALESIPRSNAITPIIFSLSNDAPLESLLAPDTVVSFDLDGTGRDQSWPWVSPETSILVWDPEETGEVTSGRQLFGSVTWWLFFDDGYRAMDALDDNRDGELSGDELVGLAVWTDANSNGVSEEGEVVPIGETGIEAIACVQTDTSMGMPANLSGLRMSDGRVLPTYDWVAQEAQVSEVAGR